MKTMTSREFNQDASGAKRAAHDGPVFITDRGKAAHVLLTMAEYERLRGEPRQTLADLLAMDEDIEFEPERIDMPLRPVDLD